MKVNKSKDHSSLSKLKKSIRDTKRLLQKPNLPAHIAVDQERKLKALQLALDDLVKGRKADLVSSRYKMIRFFERKKLARKLIQVQKQISACTDSQERQGLLDSLSLLKLQYNYVAHFPIGVPYIALFSTSPCTESNQVAKRETIMANINEKVTAGELENVAEGVNCCPYDATKECCAKMTSKLRQCNICGQSSKDSVCACDEDEDEQEEGKVEKASKKSKKSEQVAAESDDEESDVEEDDEDDSEQEDEDVDEDANEDVDEDDDVVYEEDVDDDDEVEDEEDEDYE